jgi:hypothetical protein
MISPETYAATLLCRCRRRVCVPRYDLRGGPCPPGPSCTGKATD